MENTVNERVLLIKKELNLTDQAFCIKTGISTGTLQNIKKGENVNSKTIQSIVLSLNLSEKWLFEGIGEKYNSNERPSIIHSSNDNPWKDALVSQLKDENSFLKDQLKMMREMIQIIKPQANFHNGNVYSGFLAVAETNISVRA